MQIKDLKRYGIIALSLMCMFAFKYVPPVFNLSTSGMQVIGIFIGVLMLWLTIGIDWPSILVLGALASVPELKFNAIISGSFGNSTFAFLIFTFILTYALTQTSYIKRIAVSFITCSFAAKGPWYFVLFYFASILFVGSFISPTVLFFVYLPILEQICALLNIKKGHKASAMLMMGTVIMCGISSGMTPIAHVFPLIALGLYADTYNVAISYASYMAVAIPVGIVSALLVTIMFKLVLKPDVSVFDGSQLRQLNTTKSKAGLDEKIILSVFGFVIFLWVVPGLLKNILPSGMLLTLVESIDSLGTAMPPLIGIVILSIIQLNGKSLLNIGEAMSKGVSWPSLIMCVATLALGSAITNSDIGITSVLSNQLTPLIMQLSPMVMVLIFTLWAAVQTNLSSNMVTATLVSTAALAIAPSLVGVNMAGIIINIGMMASFAFATPPAMPCVAIASSSGWTKPTQMMVYGFIAMGICVLVATFMGYPFSLLILGV